MSRRLSASHALGDDDMDKDVTLVCIVGAGPAGLVLAHILHQSNISFVVLEREQSSELRSRTKAGLIEQRAVAALRPYGLADTIIERGGRNGICEFRIDGEVIVCDYGASSDDGQGHFIYPQQELVGDWADALVAKGGQIRFGVKAVDVVENETDVAVRAVKVATGEHFTIRAETIVACDGAGSVIARAAGFNTFEIAHPFRWLAVIAAIAPPIPRTVFALHPGGFAGQFRRSATSTRYYLEVPVTDTLADWPDQRIWAELEKRMAIPDHLPLVRGDLIERDFLDLRVRVREPLQLGRLFLAGDAAHMVTPAGAKGMNMAIQDAIELAAGLRERYGDAANDDRLGGYTASRLPDIWRYQEFSNWMLGIFHAGPAAQTDKPDVVHRLRRARLDRIINDPLYARWFGCAYSGS
jgi:p-hydroxybenzoate 3-monooxygenase